MNLTIVTHNNEYLNIMHFIKSLATVV